MSLRFRRRLTLFPGVKINFSKSGISTTFGIPGASINIGKDGTYFNAGIPGTGFYTRTKLNKEEDSSPRTKDDDQFNVNYFNPLEPQQIKSEPIDKLTSDGLKGLKETLIAALKEEKEIKNDINSVSFLLQKAERSFRRFKIIPFAKYIFKNGYKRRQNEIEEKSELLNHLERQLELCNVDLVCESFNEFQTAYDDLKTAFSNLINSHFIWDIVTNKIVDRVSTRSAAHQTIERKKIQFNFKTNSFIKYKGEVFHIENFNGADIYMYPGFLLLFSNVTDFALVDYKDLEIKYAYQNFIEDEQIPRDTHIIYQTWAKVNKDGSRDLRFRDNYQIPVVAYGNIHFFSSTGVNEIYMFSNNEAAKIFCEMFVKLKSVLLGVDNNQSNTPAQKTSDKINWAYKILGVKKNSTKDEMKNSYYDLLKKYHPDKVDNLADDFKKLAEQKTKELNEAYRILSQ